MPEGISLDNPRVIVMNRDRWQWRFADRSVGSLKRRWSPRVCGLLCVAGGAILLPGTGERGSTRGNETAPRDVARTADAVRPGWVDRLQIYGMLPLFPESARDLGVTVNGLWAGIGGTDPVLPHTEHAPLVRLKYGDDAQAFAEAQHAAGLLVAGAVNGLEGMPSLAEVVPNLDDMACRMADGSVAKVGSGMALMCTNNPDWVQWEIERGKLAIDSGADVVLVDTPMSSSFVSGFLKAGWCDHCLEAFEQHLADRFSAEQLRERFSLERFDRDRVVARLAPLQVVRPMQDSPHVRDDPDARLFQQFIISQEEASFVTRKALFDALRKHAAHTGRSVAFTTNAADLGSQNPGGHWIRGIMFADLVDFFAYELTVDPLGLTGRPLTELPRGKWVAFHRLATAIHGRASPAVIHAGNMGELLQDAMSKGRNLNGWMETLAAEATAAGGSFVVYQIGVPIAETLLRLRCWDGAARHNRFVLEQRNLFEDLQRSGADLALLFLFNERGRTIPAVFPSYLGFAQGLTETHRAFDVVFGGDGHYVEDRLTAAELREYRTLIVPSPVDPTENQRQVVQHFVEDGGTVVCQEPDRLGLSAQADQEAGPVGAWWTRRWSLGKGRVVVLAGELTVTESGDLGTRFLREYSDELRQEIAMMAAELGAQPLLDMPQNDTPRGSVAVFPWVLPDERMVFHLINYDVDDKGFVQPTPPVEVRLPQLPWLGNAPHVTLSQRDQASQVLEVLVHDEGCSVVVPPFRSAVAIEVRPHEMP
jgi:hypothetical protein